YFFVWTEQVSVPDGHSNMFDFGAVHPHLPPPQPNGERASPAVRTAQHGLAAELFVQAAEPAVWYVHCHLDRVGLEVSDEDHGLAFVVADDVDAHLLVADHPRPDDLAGILDERGDQRAVRLDLLPPVRQGYEG